MSEHEFLQIVKGFMKKNSSGRVSEQDLYRFKRLFGVKPYVVSVIWKRLFPILSNDFCPSHLLWGLYFLKNYTIETVTSSITNVNEKMFRNKA